MTSERAARLERLVAALLLPAALALLCALIARGAIAGAFTAQSAAVLLAEYALFLPAMLALWGLTGRAWAAWLAGLVPLLLTLIDYFRRAINGEAFTLNDFAFAPQFGEIVRFAAPQLRVTEGIAAALAAYVLILGVLIVRHRALTPPIGRAPAVAALCGAAVFALLLFAAPGEWLTDGAPAESSTTLRLLRAYHERLQPAPTPELIEWDMTEEIPAEETEETEETEEVERPTVIFLMSESFFDCTELPHVTFDEDPIPRFHALRETCPHGKFISNTFAGGTGYVEMEVLTGLCGGLLREGDNLCSLSDEAYRALPCIADVFDEYGYRKTFLHSYTDALYNRRAIYTAFGFDEICFQDDFTVDTEWKGGYLSDLTLSRELIARYEASEEPQMLFAISMENHQPYTAGKFEGNDIAFQSDRLDEAAAEALRTYAYGARDADAALGYLTDYFAGVDDKVMIVFWGDHLPNLSTPTGSVYESLGRVTTSVSADWTTEELVSMSGTDYLIWTNYENEPREEIVGSTLFGVHVLERLGFRLSGYYRWLQERVEPFYTMKRTRLFVDAAKEAWPETPEQYRERMMQWGDMQYAMVYSGNSPFPLSREDRTYQP